MDLALRQAETSGQGHMLPEREMFADSAALGTREEDIGCGQSCPLKWYRVVVGDRERSGKN